jgi:hypothetical protein
LRRDWLSLALWNEDSGRTFRLYLPPMLSTKHQTLLLNPASLATQAVAISVSWLRL